MPSSGAALSPTTRNREGDGGSSGLGFVVALRRDDRGIRARLPVLYPRHFVARKLAAQHEPLYKFLLNKWYFDELYWNFLTKPAMWLGRFLWKKGDGALIDGLGPDGVSARVVDITQGAVRLQTGYLYHYAFAMMIGVAALITWFMFGSAH